ncbi:MAG: LysR family transcriptional regulator [Ramlibacter sp.]|nr:LysR family transcriptional regulator [Ramlibacter sp.]
MASSNRQSNPETSPAVAEGQEESLQDEISFRQIHAFLTVADIRNITQAAKQLHISQPGLSRVIATLESAVGQELFSRTGGKLSLTPFGMAFMPHARRLHSSYTDTLTAALDAHAKPLVLAGCDLVLTEIVPWLMARLTAPGHPAPRLEIHSMASHDVLERVADCKADVGLCMYGGDKTDLACTPVLNAPVGLLAPDGLALPEAINTLSDLARCPMVRLADEMVLPRMLRVRGIQADAYFNAPVVANSMSTAFAAVRGGRLATLVSAVAAASSQAHGLRFVPLPHLLPSMQLCVATRAETESNNADISLAVRRSVLALAWPPTVEPFHPPASSSKNP